MSTLLAIAGTVRGSVAEWTATQLQPWLFAQTSTLPPEVNQAVASGGPVAILLAAVIISGRLGWWRWAREIDERVAQERALREAVIAEKDRYITALQSERDRERQDAKDRLAMVAENYGMLQKILQARVSDIDELEGLRHRIKPGDREGHAHPGG